MAAFDGRNPALMAELMAESPRGLIYRDSYMATDQKAGGSNPSWRAIYGGDPLGHRHNCFPAPRGIRSLCPEGVNPSWRARSESDRKAPKSLKYKGFGAFSVHVPLTALRSFWNIMKHFEKCFDGKIDGRFLGKKRSRFPGPSFCFPAPRGIRSLCPGGANPSWRARKAPKSLA